MKPMVSTYIHFYTFLDIQIGVVRFAKMTMALFGGIVWDIEYLQKEQLEAILHNKKNKKDYVIIDVREEDYNHNGHINGAINIPYKYIDEEWTEFVLQYHKIPLIIFHCMHSEIRAPAAYNRYIHLKDSLVIKYKKTKQKRIEIDKLNFYSLNSLVIDNLCKQQCVVLEGGFNGWYYYCKENKKLELIANNKNKEKND
eukprot:57062_1